ncbi:MAG: F0F1 ATP synthase subunit epsilon [bacterium]|nr:F0F1 ATP synthase subunit epsilon [bacterium]
MQSFLLTIVTPEKKVFEQQIRSIIAPGSEGYLGILAHHAPLITSLIPGKLTIRDNQNQEFIYAISGGFLEVAGNKVTILADAIEKVEEIDIARAKRAEERAREILESRKRDQVEFTRAQAALERALNRIRVYNGHNHQNK